MKVYQADSIRNIALAGHASKGKTTLAEALLNIAGATERIGKVADGTAVTDYDAEEKKRKISVSCAVAPVEYKNTKINIIDTPGLFDFAEGAAEGIRAAETAIIVVSARSGLAVGAEKAFKAASARGMSKIIVASKMDDERADFYKSFNGMAAKFGTSVCPIVIPIITDGKVVAYYNMITEKAFAYSGAKATPVEFSHDDAARFDAIKEVFNEAVAGTDEEIMDKYFSGEELTAADKLKGLRIGVADGSVIPVFALSGLSGEACDQLLDFIADVCPAPSSEYAICDDEPIELTADANGPLAAICFKTVADPFIGKLSFFKVLSGKLTAGAEIVNASTGESERLGKIVTMFGAKQIDAAEIPAGDIGAAVKLSGFNTGDTLCKADKIIKADVVNTPQATYSMAAKAVKKGDEEKIALGFARLCEEDPSLKFRVNNETHEQIISGLGEQQIDVAVAKLKTKFAVDVQLAPPKIAYRETITKKVSAQGRHKKQSGGHGQFGDVFLSLIHI